MLFFNFTIMSDSIRRVFYLSDNGHKRSFVPFFLPYAIKVSSTFFSK